MIHSIAKIKINFQEFCDKKNEAQVLSAQITCTDKSRIGELFTASKNCSFYIYDYVIKS